VDYADALPRLEAADDALRDALGHLTTHCRCSGDSLCVPCELARDSWNESLRLRELRSKIAAFLEAVDHTLRCINAYATGPDDTPTDCSICSTLANAASSARHETTSR